MVRDKIERLDKKSKLLSNVRFIIPIDINLLYFDNSIDHLLLLRPLLRTKIKN